MRSRGHKKAWLFTRQKVRCRARRSVADGRPRRSVADKRSRRYIVRRWDICVRWPTIRHTHTIAANSGGRWSRLRHRQAGRKRVVRRVGGGGRCRRHDRRKCGMLLWLRWWHAKRLHRLGRHLRCCFRSKLLLLRWLILRRLNWHLKLQLRRMRKVWWPLQWLLRWWLELLLLLLQLRLLQLRLLQLRWWLQLRLLGWPL